MATQTPSHQFVAVSSAGGGIARQYRVQYQAQSDVAWKMYHIYRCRKQAEGCINMLNLRGLRARMVEYSICPAAA